MPRLQHFLALILPLLLFTACQNNEEVAKPMPDDAKAYLYAYTEGLISRAAPIRVQFAGLVASEEQLGETADGNIVSLSPAVEGEWVWTDRQTLTFQPKTVLEAATAYVAKVHLDKLFDNLPTGVSEVEFGFRTRDMHYSVQVDGLETPNFDERAQQILKGTITSSDYLTPEQAADLLQAKQGRSALTATWSHEPGGTVHYFTIKGVTRGNRPGTVNLSWDGDAIGVEQEGSEEFEVPALNDFKVTSVKTFGGSTPQVHIRFSDPLQEQQDLVGKVSIASASGSFRYNIEANLLKVFVNNNVTGDRKLTVHPGIASRYGDRMSKSTLWEVNFSAQQPEVRLVGNGSILPDGDQLVFPFEAIGLHSIEVEVFKIYHNNILQFLQYNRLDGNGEMHRVGEVIAREEVSLKQIDPQAALNDWTRYALDLGNFFAADPKAIYQVRIGFRRQHSLYACSNERAFDFYNVESMLERDLLQAWDGLEGRYQNYSWRHREDPCYPAYYNSDRFVFSNVLSSNLGLVVKQGEDDEYLAVATDIRTTKPLAGVQLTFYNFQQQELGKVTTDETGVTRTLLEDDAFFVVGENNDEHGYLRLDDADALSLSRFDVAGTSTQDGLKGYFYGERGVWRPGDSVFLHFVLEDKGNALPPGYPIELEVSDAQGQVRITRSGIIPTGEIYPLHFATQIDDKTGVWYARVKAGATQFTKAVRIETVKPNRFKIVTDLGAEPIKANNGKVAAKLTASWLHGAPASNLKAQSEASFRVTGAGFDAFQNYVFTDRDRRFNPSSQQAFDGTLDADGKASFSFDVPKNIVGPLQATLRTRVFEKSGNFSTDVNAFTFHPVDYYAGLLVPKNRYDVPRILIGERSSIELGAAAYDGKAAANRELSVKLYRLDWRWWWDDAAGRGSQYNRNRNLSVIEETTVRTNEQGRAAWPVQVEEWGRYLIRVCDTRSGHCASDYVYAGSPWYNERNYSEEASMLQFAADRESYEVGDDIELTFPAGAAGRALLSLENGRGVLEERWMDVKAGDNTVAIEATPEMSPTVYASLTVLQPHSQVDNDLPIRAYGVLPVSVEDPATILEPALDMKDELRPKQAFTVEVSETEGRPMTYTLAVVDEGLLSLTRFQTPDPHDAFYAREALGVKTWDVYRYVLGAHGTALNQILSIGGDAEALRNAEGERANRFEPVVLHLGPFTLAKNGKATHRLDLPNYVGAVRTMVVATNGTAHGNAEKTVPVRQPLMVLPTLPRVLGIGEMLELPVNVFAMKAGLGEVQVNVEETSGLVNMENTRQSLQFNRPGDQLIRFPLSVGQREGVARFRITAKAGREQASQEIEIDIRNPNPVQTNVDRIVLEPGANHTFAYTPFTGTDAQGTLEVTNLPAINLEKRLNYLLHYPYGCIEQTTSSAFPQLYLARFLELSKEQQSKTTQNVVATIDRIQRFQLSDGGFAYWPGNDQVSPWGTNYAGHFLLAAKAEGYTVPNSLLRNWTRFQREAARNWDPNLSRLGYVSTKRYLLDQAYRLYTLALAGEAELGAMNRLRENKQLDVVSRWRLAAAYALIGQKDAAGQLVGKVSNEMENYRELGWSYGSRLRDRAMLLEAMILMERTDAANRTAELIAQEMGSNAWLNTQEVAFSLMAYSKYIGADEKLQREYTFSFQQSGAAAVDAGSDHPYMQINLENKPSEIRIKNTSQQKLFCAIIRQGKPLPEAEVASNSLLNMNIQYLDEAGAPIDITNLTQGTDFLAKVTIQHTGELSYRYEELALNQVFPSGWEITNTRFEGLPNTQDEDNYDYRDYRDDQVNTFFDLGRNNKTTYVIPLTATYAGRFYHSATSCSAMYDNKIYANSEGYWVDVATRTVQ